MTTEEKKELADHIKSLTPTDKLISVLFELLRLKQGRDKRSFMSMIKEEMLNGELSLPEATEEVLQEYLQAKKRIIDPIIKIVETK